MADAAPWTIPTAVEPGPTLEGLLAHADRVLDWPRLHEIERQHAGKGIERKYLRTEEWLSKLWNTATMAGLLDRKPLRILDLGVGAGHFSFICSYLGHETVSLDQPGIPLYGALSEWLGVSPVSHRIAPFLSLPDCGHRFDLVTAFRIGFNLRRDGSLYDLAEWEFFLNDIRDHMLVEGGELCLKMNGQPNRVGRKHGDPELMRLFEDHNGRFPHGRYIMFSPLT